MKKMVRNVLGGLIAYGLIGSGLYCRVKRRAISERKIIPLFFHTINGKLFIKCIQWLRKQGYVFISTEQLINFLQGKEKIPDRAVWITFDDGWKENIDCIIPLIIEYNIPVTFFVSTDPVENGGVFWWSYVLRYGKHLSRENNLKTMRQISEGNRKELVRVLEGQFSSQMKREAMTVQDVSDIAQLAQVTVGCHTVNHVIMPNCNDDELNYEIKNSKEKLESWTSKRVISFAYPEGEFNHHVKELLKNYGFELAATTKNKYIEKKDDPLEIPRFWVRGEGFFSEAKCQMLGIWIPLLNKIQEILNWDFDIESIVNFLKDVFIEIL